MGVFLRGTGRDLGTRRELGREHTAVGKIVGKAVGNVVGKVVRILVRNVRTYEISYFEVLLLLFCVSYLLYLFYTQQLCGNTGNL